MPDDMRSRTRVRTALEATVSSGTAHTYTLAVRNISLKGMLCDPAPDLGAPRACAVLLRLAPDAALHIGARVVRNDASGLALDFEEMDEESFFHLRNIVRYHAGDADAIDQELAHPAFRPARPA